MKSYSVKTILYNSIHSCLIYISLHGIKAFINGFYFKCWHLFFYFYYNGSESCSEFFIVTFVQCGKHDDSEIGPQQLLVWRHQIMMILEAYSIIKFLDDSGEVLDQFLKDNSDRFTTEANLEFINWKNSEQALLTFINSTLSPS